MKRILLIMLALCASTGISFAQPFCVTDISGSKGILAPDLTHLNRGSAANFQGKYFIRLAFHILRNSDGTGGRTSDEVYTAVSNLSAAYNPHNICFSIRSIDYIDSTDLYKKYFTSDNFLTNIWIRYNPSAINIYVLPLKGLDNKGKANGVIAYLYPTALTHYVNLSLAIGGTIEGQDLFLEGGLAHELGHVMGLLHTHESGATCPELVDGSNCTTCGDLICDTKASPNLNYDTVKVNDATCEYRGADVDANNMLYNPDVHNIMSYNFLHCIDEFSADQGARMRGFLATFPEFKKVIIPENETVQNLNLASVYVPIPYALPPLPDTLYKVYGTLTSKNVSVGVNCKLHYTAGDAVIINDGFIADEGSQFIAEINDMECNELTHLNAARGAMSDEAQFEKFLTAMEAGAKAPTSAQEVWVYPNPVYDRLNVQYNGKGAGLQIELTDITGKVLLTSTVRTIDVSHLTPGVYLYRIVADGKTAAQGKVIKR